MNLLFLCQRVPYPPDRGDRITTWHFLQHLQQRATRIRLGCFAEEDRDAEGINFLQRAGIEVCAPRLDRRQARLLSLRGLLTGEALTLPFFRSRELQRQIAAWRQQQPPDLSYVYSSSMAQYLLPDPGRRSIMQFAELDSDKWRQFAARSGPLGRFVYGREARRLLQFEARVARNFGRSLVVSEVEAELFRRCIPGVEPAVLPNGVDVEHFCSQGEAERQPQACIFTGVMDYEPNVDGICWFAAACWPQLRAQFPAAQLLVVGSKPTAAVQALARLPGVTVTGRVPTTPPWFDRAAVAIAPLRLARGVQNKVLEALSMGLPVVSSSAAAQGLGELPSGPLAIADSAAATVAAVARWFADPALARADGAAAAAYVRAHWRWERMYARLDQILAELDR